MSSKPSKDTITIMLETQERLKWNICGFFSILILISLAIVIFTGLIYNNINKLGALSSPITYQPSPIRIDYIRRCSHLCDKNLCLNDFNIEECYVNPATVKQNCNTKEKCYSNCIEFYKEKVDEQCFVS